MVMCTMFPGQFPEGEELDQALEEIAKKERETEDAKERKTSL